MGQNSQVRIDSDPKLRIESAVLQPEIAKLPGASR